MVSFVKLCGACLPVLIGVFVHFCGPHVVTKLFIWAHIPDARQKRFIPTKGPFLSGNLIRGDFVAPVFTTDAQIDWLDKEFKHRQGDVWVTTYAKVGTTWTQYIVTLLAGHPPGGMMDILQHCPWPEVAHGGLRTFPNEKFQESASAEGGPRCFKSHWMNRDHMDIDKLPATSKVIFVYRDTESVFKSYYHHTLDKYGIYAVTPEDFPNGKSWDTMFEMFMHGELEYGCYMKHLASWWKARDRPNVLMVRYHDLKNHHADVIRNISKFIGVEANESVVEHVRHESSFSVMKKSFEGDLAEKFLKWAGVFRGSHMRSGGGDEKSPFTPEQLALLQQRYEEVLKPLGMPRDLVLSHKLP